MNKNIYIVVTKYHCCHICTVNLTSTLCYYCLGILSACFDLFWVLSAFAVPYLSREIKRSSEKRKRKGTNLQLFICLSCALRGGHIGTDISVFFFTKDVGFIICWPHSVDIMLCHFLYLHSYVTILKSINESFANASFINYLPSTLFSTHRTNFLLDWVVKAKVCTYT